MLSIIIGACLRGEGEIVACGSFRRCQECGIYRPHAQYHGETAAACQLCADPARFPLSHPLTAWETRNHLREDEATPQRGPPAGAP
jgi:hypothetical protein